VKQSVEFLDGVAVNPEVACGFEDDPGFLVAFE
jgi:hypothetical protein